MTDFSALGFDPAPGDLATVEGFAADVTSGYDGVEDALAMLDTDDDAAWTGKAAVAFRAAMSEEFRPQLRDTGEALRISRDALGTWASQLSSHQYRARQLAEEATAALAAVNERSAAHEQAEAGADDEDADPDAVTNASLALSSAQSDLDAIRSAAHALKDEVDADAVVAANGLLEAGVLLEAYAGNAFLNFLGDVGAAIVDGAEWLMDNLVPILEDILRAVLPIISILALFIPVLGTVALVISITLVAIDLLQAVTGRGTWTDFVIGAGSLVLGLAMGGLAKSLFPKGEVLVPSFQGMTPAVAGGSSAAAGSVAVAFNINLPNLVSSSYWAADNMFSAYNKGTGFADAVAEPWQNIGERLHNLFDGNGPRTNEEL